MNRWDYTLRLGDVFHNDDLSFPKKRDVIAGRISELPLTGELRAEALLLAHYIAATEDVEDFDYVWGDFYNFADRARIWVQTWVRS